MADEIKKPNFVEHNIQLYKVLIKVCLRVQTVPIVVKYRRTKDTIKFLCIRILSHERDLKKFINPIKSSSIENV